MSPATLADRPYVNSNLFSDHYIDERLPDPDDVADGLERYVDAKARAEELDEKIERADELIDEVVYALYGLTDEAIETLGERSRRRRGVSEAAGERPLNPAATVNKRVESPGRSGFS
jgi:hypothetical protein